MPLSKHSKPSLSDAAKRALKEAIERQKTQQSLPQNTPKELGGREGLDPVRFGDWEKKGIAVDF